MPHPVVFAALAGFAVLAVLLLLLFPPFQMYLLLLPLVLGTNVRRRHTLSLRTLAWSPRKVPGARWMEIIAHCNAFWLQMICAPQRLAEDVFL